MLNNFPDSNPAIILSILFLTVSVMTNFLTNNASAALFMPLGISLATSLNVRYSTICYNNNISC